MTDDTRRALPPSIHEGCFDAYYYANCCGRPYDRSEPWMRFFGTIADRVVADIAPRRVLDAGCAYGLLVEALRARGVDAVGIDLSSFALEQAHADVKPFLRRASISDDLAEDYDLVVCIEVVEHMPAREAEAAIANICRHTHDVLFSSSPIDYREPTHVNVHQPEYWAEMFARHRFYRDVDYDASFITAWAARFRQSAEPVHRIVCDYERRYAELARAANDARSYALEVQERVASAETAREEYRRLADEACTAQRTAREELAQARDRIGHMERSLFWKARLLLNAVLGRRG